jgi:hypothetical protein
MTNSYTFDVGKVLHHSTLPPPPASPQGSEAVQTPSVADNLTARGILANHCRHKGRTG